MHFWRNERESYNFSFLEKIEMASLAYQNGFVRLKRCDRHYSRLFGAARRLASQPLPSELSKEEVDNILRRNERTVFIGEGKRIYYQRKLRDFD